MEHRKDAQYDVRVETPAGTIISLKKADYDTAFTACKSLQESTKDEHLLEKLNSCMRSFGFCGASGNGYSVNISASLPLVETGERQTCGRRMSDIGPWERKDHLDTWELRGKDRCCSFCGSLHPDRVIELVEEHGLSILERSTKGYKWYVHQPNVPNASFGGIKYYRQHDTPRFIDELNRLLDAAKDKQAAAAK